jgi:hypothetical protein
MEEVAAHAGLEILTFISLIVGDPQYQDNPNQSLKWNSSKIICDDHEEPWQVPIVSLTTKRETLPIQIWLDS